ncbi:hypothetical protein [Fluviicola sp.]|uniref:hypothetical protein n=1 Tax=Fluviicola sp. TaxID=1917219 RepID=UPI0031D82136
MNLKTIIESLLSMLISTLFLWVITWSEKRGESGMDQEKILPVAFLFKDREEQILKHLSEQWSWKSVELTSDPVKNVPVFRTVRKTLNELKASHDSLHGIRIDFPDELVFRDYIKLLEICGEKEPRVFIPVSNTVFALADHRENGYWLQE